MTDAAPPPPTDLRNTLEEMRASVAAECARKGLKGALQEAILGFLTMLIALLEEFRAGRLAAAAPTAGEAPGGAGACGAGADYGEEEAPTPVACIHRRFAAEDAENRRGSPLFAPPNSLEQRGDERESADNGGPAAGGAGVADIAQAVAAGGGLPADPQIFLLRASRRPPRRKAFTAGGAARNTPGIRRTLPRYTPPCRAGPLGPDSKKQGPGRSVYARPFRYDIAIYSCESLAAS